MKVTSLMVSGMVKENFIIKMADTMKVNGKPIKCMVGEDYTMKEENLRIKEIGLKTNFMVLAKSTMTTQCSWNAVLILLISTYFKIIGSIMKECLPRIQNKVEEKSC